MAAGRRALLETPKMNVPTNLPAPGDPPDGRARELPADADGSDVVSDDDQRTSVVLTRREREVIRLIAEGLTNRQIAERLTLSVRTVERHIENVYNRLGCTGKAGRAVATAYAIRHGLTHLT